MKSKYLLLILIAGTIISLFISSCTTEPFASNKITSNISNAFRTKNTTDTTETKNINTNTSVLPKNTSTVNLNPKFRFTIDCTKKTKVKCFAESDTKEGWALGLVNKTLVSSLKKEFDIPNSTQIISLSNNSINNIRIKRNQANLMLSFEKSIGSEVLSFSNKIRSLVSSHVVDTTNSLNFGVQYMKVITLNKTNLWNFSYGKSNSDLTTILISFDGTKIIS